MTNFQNTKAQLGQDFEFIVSLPTPTNPATPNQPILNIVGQGFSNQVILTPERLPLSVNAIANDRKTLTLTANTLSLKPLQREAFLLTNSDNFYPISLTRISGTTAILSEPLPKDIEIGGGGLAGLVFATYRTTLPTNPYTATKQTLSLSVEYLENFSTTTARKIIKSSLKVCAKPFATGLTHTQLLDNFPNLGEVMSRRQTDLNAFIDGGETDLLLVVRDALFAKNCTEDEIFNAEIFQQPHLYFSVARIYEVIGQLEIAEKMRTRAYSLLDAALKIVSLDLDGDGIIDPEETIVPAKGGKPTDLQGNFYGRNVSEYESQFVPRRGMRF